MNSGKADVRGVARDFQSPRPERGPELGPPEQGSEEALAAKAAATPGCAVTLVAWDLVRAGLDR
jgi:hypothetical protein